MTRDEKMVGESPGTAGRNIQLFYLSISSNTTVKKYSAKSKSPEFKILNKYKSIT